MILRVRTFSAQRRVLSSLVILESLVYSQILAQRPRLLLEHHTICLQRSLRVKAIVLSLISGHLVYSCTRWQLWPHLSTQARFINWLRKLSRETTLPYHLTSPPPSPILCRWCLRETPRKDQISISYSRFPSLSEESSDSFQVMPSEMNFHTLSYTTRMCSMSSSASKPVRRLKRRRRLRLPRHKPKLRQLSSRWQPWMYTSHLSSTWPNTMIHPSLITSTRSISHIWPRVARVMPKVFTHQQHQESHVTHLTLVTIAIKMTYIAWLRLRM